MATDMLTKSLPKPKHRKCIEMSGLNLHNKICIEGKCWYVFDLPWNPSLLWRFPWLIEDDICFWKVKAQASFCFKVCFIYFSFFKVIFVFILFVLHSKAFIFLLYWIYSLSIHSNLVCFFHQNYKIFVMIKLCIIFETTVNEMQTKINQLLVLSDFFLRVRD